ncbi:MAG: glutathione S-transferase family protein [Sphingobium sp.]|nr:glutathione S-transferase family protein [Sphingobium sp.]
MSYRLFAHPFSSYSWKAMIAFHEKGVAFDLAMLEDPGVMDALRNLWPVGQFPVLLDGERTVIEATMIIEYLDLRHPGPARLIPADPEAALDVRFMDRLFDNHVMNVMQRIVAEYLPPNDTPNPATIATVQGKLEIIYAWLDRRLAGQDWATPHGFSMADCAAAPSLFYADWVHRIPETMPNLRAYRARLNARPSVSRCIEEARPYRPYFPLGAPDRD